MPDNMVVVDNDGSIAAPPEAIETPDATDPEVYREAARLEHVPTGRVQWTLKAIDAEYSPSAPASDIADSADAKRLADYATRAAALAADTDRAVAAERGRWDDPKTTSERVNRILERAARDAESLYRETREAARAFVVRYAAPPPTPDEGGALDLAQGIIMHAPPDRSYAWFLDRYHSALTSPTGARVWPVLRMVCSRVAAKAPPHLHGGPWQDAFRRLAEMPFDDPSVTARTAREYSAEIVGRVRSILHRWSVQAASGTM